MRPSKRVMRLVYLRTQLVDSALILQCLQVPFGACESLVVYLLRIRGRPGLKSRHKNTPPPHCGRRGSLTFLPLRLFPPLLRQFVRKQALLGDVAHPLLDPGDWLLPALRPCCRSNAKRPRHPWVTQRLASRG